jgi:signal transduction histidine kinase
MPDLSVEISIEGDRIRFDENKEIMLYRIIQEMVNNTLKHAEATKINLEIKILPEELFFIYSDDGKGFDLNEKLASKSLGMMSIESRVKFLGGELDAFSEPGNGVRYTYTIPA